jgi:hypothetical protein
MRRTTIRMSEHLLAEAKQLAARRNRTLTAVIEDALRESLARARMDEPHRPLKLTTYGSGGLQPGVDLDNSADLWELLDEADDPR